MSAGEAADRGYTVDRSAAGCWYAYKGARFSSVNQGIIIETQDETYLRLALEKVTARADRMLARWERARDCLAVARQTGISKFDLIADLERILGVRKKS